MSTGRRRDEGEGRALVFYEDPSVRMPQLRQREVLGEMRQHRMLLHPQDIRQGQREER